MNKFHRNLEKGFTLLELMVAISIFGLIALMGWQILGIMLTTSKKLASSSDSFFDLQKSIFRLTRDISQISDRPIIDVEGLLVPATTYDPDENILIFSTKSLVNLKDDLPVEIRRIRYSLAHNDADNAFDLYREDLGYLDEPESISSYIERKQLVLSNIKSMSVEFTDSSGDVFNYWPAKFIEGVQGGLPIPLNILPSGISFTLQTEQWGSISRNIVVREITSPPLQ